MELEIDDIRVTYGEYGKLVERIELLLLPNAKMTLDIEDGEIKLIVEDTDVDDVSVDGTIELDTLTALIKQLQNVRKQLIKKQE